MRCLINTFLPFDQALRLSAKQCIILVNALSECHFKALFKVSKGCMFIKRVALLKYFKLERHTEAKEN